MSNGSLLPFSRRNGSEPTAAGLSVDCRNWRPDGADNQCLHKAAEIAIKEKFGKALTLKPITKQAASLYLEVDPVPEHGM
jgi:hypothetical protein